MIFGINTTRDISKLSQIMYNNFNISLAVFIQNTTTNHAITYTNTTGRQEIFRTKKQTKKRLLGVHSKSKAIVNNLNNFVSCIRRMTFFLFLFWRRMKDWTRKFKDGVKIKQDRKTIFAEASKGRICR